MRRYARATLRFVALVLAFGTLVAIRPSLAEEAPVETTTGIHVPRHRSADALLPLARAAMGEDGSATADGDAVVLVGRPEAVGRARALLEARDRPEPMITLTVESHSARRLRTAGYEIRWGSGGSHFAVGTIALHEPGARRAPAGRAYRSGQDTRKAAVLQIRNGQTGRIDLHEVVPLRARGFWGGETSVIDFRSGLEATPRLLGSGRVDLELGWSQADVSPSGHGVVEGVTTTIVVEPGESVVVGATSRRVDATDALRASSDRSRLSSDALLLLRVDVTRPPG